MRDEANEEGVDRSDGAGSADSVNEEFEVGSYRPSSFIMKNIHKAERMRAKAAKAGAGSSSGSAVEDDDEKDEMLHSSASQAADTFDSHTRSEINMDDLYLY
jgi:hypothetical protein